MSEYVVVPRVSCEGRFGICGLESCVSSGQKVKVERRSIWGKEPGENDRKEKVSHLGTKASSESECKTERKSERDV